MGTLLLASVMLAGSAAGTIPSPPRESLTASAVRIAGVIARDAVPAAQDAKGQWDDVTALAINTRIRVKLRDGASREGRLEAVTGDRLVVMSESGVPSEISRADIVEVSRRKRRSWVGGIAGALAGGVAGVFSAAFFAFKQCGDSCADESIGIYGSLIGMPLAGAALGSRVGGLWTVVYRG